MARDGRVLEKLTNALEKALATGEVTIESPAYLADRTTGQKREVDVLITKGKGHHKHLIAIECRARKAPVGVPDIEAFHTKINDLRINKAVFVSSSGYRKSAIEKANFYNISCLDLDDSGDIEWLLVDTMTIFTRRIVKCAWSVNRHQKFDSDNLTVFLSGGEIVTPELLTAQSQKLFQELDLSQCEPNQIYGQAFPVSTSNLILKNLSTGEDFPVTDAEVYLEWEVTKKEIPIKKVIYGDKSEGQNLVKAAVSELDLGNIEGHLLIVENEDGTKDIKLTTSAKA